MKMTPRDSAAGRDPYPKVRQHYERQHKVRFSEGQWLEVQNEAMSGSGASRRPEAYLRRLHTTAERFAQFLSLGSPEPRRRRRRRPSEGKPRGPYARPLLERIDLVLHVNGCKSVARQLGIRWRWRDLAEAHWKQAGIREDPDALEQRYRAAKKMLHAAVPTDRRWLCGRSTGERCSDSSA